jgi:hypothetical protein
LILVGSDPNNLAGSKPNGAVVMIAKPRSCDAVLKNLVIFKKLAILWGSHDLEYLGSVITLVDLYRLVCEFHRPTGDEAESKYSDNHPATWVHNISAVHLVSPSPNGAGGE